MKTILPYLIFLAMLFCGALSSRAEPFEKIKADLAEAKGLHIHFLSMIESSVFETVDSFPGYAHICSDGRYFMEVGADQFLFDGTYLYSYSPTSNQIIMEIMTSSDPTGEQVTFISRLDDYFETSRTSEPGKYKLVRNENASDALPDSMTITLDPTNSRMSMISFSDINEDLNYILLDSIVYLKDCDTTELIPAFPDSAETVRLF